MGRRRRSGSVGDGTHTSRPDPVHVGTDTAWTGIDTGYFNAVALRADGTMWSWGGDDDGGLGNGAPLNSRSSPTQIGSGTRLSAVFAGGFNGFAIS